jgi:hypothetical protein
VVFVDLCRHLSLGVPSTANAAGTNGLTCLPKHREAREIKYTLFNIAVAEAEAVAEDRARWREVGEAYVQQ